jgi:hypothetical protein
MKPGILIAGLACAAFAQVHGLAQTEKAGPNGTVPAPAKAIAIVGGKLLTITHGTIEDGTSVVGRKNCRCRSGKVDQGSSRSRGL